MTEMYLRRIGSALHPASTDDLEALERLPIGTALKVDVKQPRDRGRHRYVFKLFQTAHRALPEGWNLSFDTFRKALTIDAGYYETYRTPDGDEQKVALSLSYGSMDEATHRTFCDDLIKCLCSRWVPGLDSQAFTDEIGEAIR